MPKVNDSKDKHPTDTTIRNTIKKTIQEQGLSQRQLAKRIGVVPSTISQVLAGQRGDLPDTLLKILDELKLEVVLMPKLTQE